MVERNEYRIFNYLFELRTERGADGLSSIEIQTGREPNTVSLHSLLS